MMKTEKLPENVFFDKICTNNCIAEKYISVSTRNEPSMDGCSTVVLIVDGFDFGVGVYAKVDPSGFQEHALQNRNNDTNSLAGESINSKFGSEQIRYGPAYKSNTLVGW